MTSTSFINETLSHIKNYKGAYPSDDIPNFKLPAKGTNYVVINTDKSDESGEHWVCLAMDKSKCHYFDSFGLHILESGIGKYVKKMGYNKYVYNSKAIQPFYSEKCGYYVIAFILAIESGESFKTFINQFTRIKNNDKILIKSLKKYTRK